MPIANQRLCGATTRKGAPCADIAMANGRCKKHGGRTPQTNPHSRLNARTHGLYDDLYSAEELKIAQRMKLGIVDDELKLVRIKLRRALIAKETWSLAEDKDEHLETVEITDEDVVIDGVPIPKTKKVRKLPDFDGHIDRFIGRIANLEKLRFELGGNDANNDGPMEKAAAIKSAVDELFDDIPDPVDE